MKNTEEFQRWLSVESSLGFNAAIVAERDHWQTVAEELKCELMKTKECLSDAMARVYNLEVEKSTRDIKL